MLSTLFISSLIMPQIDLVIFISAVVSLISFFLFSSLSSLFSFVNITGLIYTISPFNTLLRFISSIKPNIQFGFFFSFSTLLFNSLVTFGFQTPASINMAAMICTHNDIYYFLIVILTIVSWLLVVSLYKFTQFISPFSSEKAKYWWENPQGAAEIFDSCTILEILWTVIPTLVLLFIGYPNISLLYALDQIPKTWFNIKIIGHQWYWTYEYSSITFKEYIDPSNSREAKLGQRWVYDSTLVEDYNLLDRLKECGKPLPSWFETEYNLEPELDFKYVMVDNPLLVPAHVPIQAIISSADVLHSWAVPVLGIKMDACPGRLNRIIFKVDIDSRIYQSVFKSRILRFLATMDSPFYLGYWGQCSELCGVGHGFMPIIIHAVNIKNLWLIFDDLFNNKETYEKHLFHFFAVMIARANEFFSFDMTLDLFEQQHKWVPNIPHKAFVRIRSVIDQMHSDPVFGNIYPSSKLDYHTGKQIGIQLISWKLMDYHMFESENHKFHSNSLNSVEWAGAMRRLNSASQITDWNSNSLYNHNSDYY